mmetsp:Transcript_31503/g.74874  ORF Transcript_31503/g.74874 Transcript_31503/m.74874 type:complete len:213 (+) Transcript_31503:299-937(+)
MVDLFPQNTPETVGDVQARRDRTLHCGNAQWDRWALHAGVDLLSRLSTARHEVHWRYGLPETARGAGRMPLARPAIRRRRELLRAVAGKPAKRSRPFSVVQRRHVLRGVVRGQDARLRGVPIRPDRALRWGQVLRGLLLRAKAGHRRVPLRGRRPRAAFWHLHGRVGQGADERVRDSSVHGWRELRGAVEARQEERPRDVRLGEERRGFRGR